jgi:hypothetical protein
MFEKVEDKDKKSLIELCKSIEDKLMNASEKITFVKGFNNLDDRKGNFEQTITYEKIKSPNLKDDIAEELAKEFVRSNTIENAKPIREPPIKNPSASQMEAFSPFIKSAITKSISIKEKTKIYQSINLILSKKESIQLLKSTSEQNSVQNC